jgi:hypothetical protein
MRVLLMQLEEITVTCYAGCKHNERPVSITVRGRVITITEVIDRWYEGNADAAMPVLDYYKVRGDDGADYIIRDNHLFDKWALLSTRDTGGVK